MDAHQDTDPPDAIGDLWADTESGAPDLGHAFDALRAVSPNANTSTGDRRIQDDEAQRPVGTAILVAASVLLPLVGIIWGLFRIARGDHVFGAALVATSATLTVVALLIAG